MTSQVTILPLCEAIYHGLRIHKCTYALMLQPVSATWPWHTSLDLISFIWHSYLYPINLISISSLALIKSMKCLWHWIDTKNRQNLFHVLTLNLIKCLKCSKKSNSTISILVYLNVSFLYTLF